MMKKLSTFLLAVFALTLVIKAQETEGTFTDEELTKYATVMKWAKDEKGKLSSVVSDSVKIWIEGSELTASQYNVLSKAKKKGTLEEVEASEAELAMFEEVSKKIDEKKTAFTDNYKTKIKENIGAGLYNSLKKALKSDPALKERYQSILAGLDTDESEDEASDES